VCIFIALFLIINLTDREVICFNQSAHQSSITGLVTFMGEPIFVSSSVDNSVKVLFHLCQFYVAFELYN